MEQQRNIEEGNTIKDLRNTISSHSQILDVVDGLSHIIKKLNYLSYTVDCDVSGEGMAFLLGDQADELDKLREILEGLLEKK